MVAWPPRRMKMVHSGGRSEAESPWCRVPVLSLVPVACGTTDCRSPAWGSTQARVVELEATAPAAASVGRWPMEVLYERCVGLDVHRDTVVACLIAPEGRELRTFGTMTEDLLALADWLAVSEV